MKIYRYVKLNEVNGSFFSRGYELEGLNLIRYHYMAPSYRSLDSIACKKGTLANTFGPEQELTKYFFLSLLDTISWTCTCLNHDVKNHHLLYEYAILEIDLPDEVIKSFLGLGFYDNYSSLETRIPYTILYKYLNENNNEVTKKAIELFNLHMGKIIFPWNKEIRNFIKENKGNKDIINNKARKLYSYLCFPITKEYGLLDPCQEKDNYDWPLQAYDSLKHMNALRQEINYYEQINNCPNQDNLFSHAYPLISEENNQAKLILAKNNYKFQKKKGENK